MLKKIFHWLFGRRPKAQIPDPELSGKTMDFYRYQPESEPFPVQVRSETKPDDEIQEALEGAIIGGVLGGSEGALVGGLIGGVGGGIVGGLLGNDDYGLPSIDSAPEVAGFDGGGGDFSGGGSQGDF